MFIILVSIHPYPSPQAVPLANAFLQSYLSTISTVETQKDTKIINFYLGQDISTLVTELIHLKPDAIGFSIYVWNRSVCLEIANKIRKTKPDIRIFAGGPEATADPEGVLKSACVDFLIIGEGEQPFATMYLKMLADENIFDIPGIASLSKNGLKLTQQQPISDLDSIPSPWLNNILDAGQYKGLLWQLSRGCAFSCDFCFDSRGNAGVRRFSLARIEEELKHFVKTEVSQIFVLDSTFNQDAQRAKTILRLIKKNAPHIHFHFEVRSEFIDKEMAQLFAQITCSLQIGLQSADPSVLKEIGRIFNRKDFEKRVALLNETGAVFGFDLMYGLPGETLQGFNESLDFALSLYPNHLDIFPLAILPGTALASRSGSVGLKHLSTPPYTLISSDTFSRDELAMAAKLANACDVFYTRGKAVAWFNSVATAVKMRPSVFLNQFADWLAIESDQTKCEADLEDHEIWQMQRRFLSKLFTPKKLKRLLPLALDLVDYHYHYASAMLIPPPDLPDESELNQLLKRPLKLAPSTRMAKFNFEILDILEAGEPDISKFCDMVKQAGSWAAIYPSEDGIRTESFIKPYFQLLEKLDGKTPCGLIADRLGIPNDEALELLEFAILEGIVI